MSNDSNLIKEFKSRDVNRLRNIYAGKGNQSTVTQVGYEKRISDYVEGDVWAEDGKEWTIKDGLKQSHTKLGQVKKILSVPFCCPNCKTRMKDKLDPRFFNLFGHCFSCQQSRETEMKLNGTYESYAKDIMTANALTYISDARAFVSEVANRGDIGIYTETGEKQNWSGPAINTQVADQFNKELDELEQKLNQQ